MRKTAITAVGTVGLPVADQDRALAFYTGVLGFEVRRDVPFGEHRWIEVAPAGAATTIALVPAGVPAGVRLLARDAGVAHTELRAHGVDTDTEIMRLDVAPPMFGLRDPDGNSLIVVASG